ncbi:hypothetical protein KR018_009731 [Drosophila ironensis]|nr:hypothetical protein KR018_009731 [Drosophila ironensis]
MGLTHSMENAKRGEETTVTAAGGPGGICCLVPRSGGMQGWLAKMHSILRQRVSISARKQKRLSKLARSRSKSSLLRPMPRCSSFGSCGTLLTPTKRSATPSDRQYAQWKCSLEHSIAAPAQEKRHLHDISEAIAGQTTPKGFPSHTDARRCPHPIPEEACLPESPLYDLVDNLKVRRRLSLRQQPRLPMRRPSNRQKAAQAQIEAQIQKELCDLEDYYGGFHFAQRSERLVRI